jgi:hypothetical protein
MDFFDLPALGSDSSDELSNDVEYNNSHLSQKSKNDNQENQMEIEDLIIESEADIKKRVILIKLNKAYKTEQLISNKSLFLCSKKRKSLLNTKRVSSRSVLVIC